MNATRAIHCGGTIRIFEFPKFVSEGPPTEEDTVSGNVKCFISDSVVHLSTTHLARGVAQ